MLNGLIPVRLINDYLKSISHDENKFSNLEKKVIITNINKQWFMSVKWWHWNGSIAGSIDVAGTKYNGKGGDNIPFNGPWR
jgi:hypothetical protein